MRYALLIIPDAVGRGYTVDVPALPGCVTQGDTLEEAIKNARDAIAQYLEGETAESLAAAGVNLDVIVKEIEVPVLAPV
jgi:predicted RNase H-like HicB family nuclease